MPTSRKIFVLAAVALGCHFVALAFHSALASGVIEFTLIVLAAAACFQAAGRASGFARRFWRLMGIAFALYSAGQVIATYYDSVLHASLVEWWPSDVLFLYHVAPMAMALFLADDSAGLIFYKSESSPSRHISFSFTFHWGRRSSRKPLTRCIGGFSHGATSFWRLRLY